MSSGFLLLETLPGREGHLLDLLARFPGVTQRSVVYPGALALKLEAPAVDILATELRRLEGVIATRLYRAKNV